jgi:iron(III) transport system permease protein
LLGALLYFAALPLGLLLRHALSGAEPLAAFEEMAAREINWVALRGTLTVSGGTALLAFAIGLPCGWLVAATDLPGSRRWRSLLSLPYVVPPYLGAVGWTYLLSERAGWLNRLLADTFGLGPVPLVIYSTEGIVFVLGVFFSPFVLMAVSEAVERLDPALEEAARVSGASAFTAWRQVTWPLIRRAAVGGALLAFLASAASYGVPAVLGPSAKPPVQVLTTRVKSCIDLHTTGGFRQATALSSLLLLAALLFPLAESVSRPDPRSGAVRSARRVRARLGRWKWPVLVGVGGLFCCTTLLPVLALLASSVMTNIGQGFGWSNLSLVHYRHLLQRPDALRAAGNSLMLAAGAATLAVSAGLGLALLQTRGKSRASWLVTALAWLPFATPGTVLAIGFILAFTGAWGLNLYGTLWLLLAAYTVKLLALAYRLVLAGIEQTHPSLEESARVCGATPGAALTQILLPLLRGHLATAWFLVFMPCVGELTMSILLFGPDTPTLGTMLFELQSYEDPSAASVLAVLILALVLTANALVRRSSGGRYGI